MTLRWEKRQIICLDTFLKKMFQYVLTLPTLYRLFRTHVIQGDTLKLIYELALANEEDVYEFLIEYTRDNLKDGTIHCDLKAILNSCLFLSSRKSVCFRSFGQLVEKWNQCSKHNSFIYADNTGKCVGDVFVDSNRLFHWLQHTQTRNVSHICLGIYPTTNDAIRQVKQYGFKARSFLPFQRFFYTHMPSSTLDYGHDNDKDGSGIVCLISSPNNAVLPFTFNDTQCVFVQDTRVILPLGFIEPL